LEAEMREANEKYLCLLGAVALVFALPLAGAEAQGNPEGGDVAPPMQGGGQYGGSVQGDMQGQGAWQPPPGPMPQPMPQPMPGQPMADGSMPPDDGMGQAQPPASDSDHAAVVGRFGIGFFGVQSVPIMGCDTSAMLCTALADNSLSAPTIGIRYWLDEGLGIEAALGLNISSAEIGVLQTGAFALALHGGVPLALAHSGHFVFQVVPQINFGIASGSYEVPGTTADVSGMLIEAGAKAGAEIHFGFIDIPQLSLQGTVGLLVRHESRSVDTTTALPPATTTAEQSETFFGTGVDGEPWDIFTGSITAVYYF
jgi:hypothetical protein